MHEICLTHYMVATATGSNFLIYCMKISHRIVLDVLERKEPIDLMVFHDVP